jgi:putative DNA primase/helicase
MAKGTNGIGGQAVPIAVPDPQPTLKRVKAPSKPKPIPPKTPNWRRLLQCTPEKRDGVIVGYRVTPNLFNIALILTHHPAWKGVLLYDEFSERIVKTRRVPTTVALDRAPGTQGPWVDEDTEAARVWFQAVERMTITASDFAAGLLHASKQNSRHPVRTYLNEWKPRWDHKKRVETVLIDYFGVEDTPYTRGVTRCWFISAVARVMEPGCQADYALILESPQGWGKSRALRHLMPSGKGSWFSETGIILGNKDSYQNLHGIWIYCLDEMASVHGAEVRTMKNFLTSPDDRYRPSYGHYPQNFARQNVFICTVNPEAGGYFADRTGNRRFWPVTVTKVDVEGLTKVRDQIWAEARVLYDKKMPSAQRPAKTRWWPDAGLMALCAEEQKKRLHVEPWTDIIDSWIKAGGPMRNEMGEFTQQRVNTARGITTAEVLQHALGINPGQMNLGASIRAARTLRDMGFGFSQQETHGGVRDRYYKPGAPILKVPVQPKSINT